MLFASLLGAIAQPSLFTLKGAAMTELEQLNKLEFAWLEAKRNWEAAHLEIDGMMRRHLDGEGPVPGAVRMEAQNDLLFLMRAAWSELDHFMRAHSDLLTDTRQLDSVVEELRKGPFQDKNDPSSGV